MHTHTHTPSLLLRFLSRIVHLEPMWSLVPALALRHALCSEVFSESLQGTLELVQQVLSRTGHCFCSAEHLFPVCLTGSRTGTAWDLDALSFSGPFSSFLSLCCWPGCSRNVFPAVGRGVPRVTLLRCGLNVKRVLLQTHSPRLCCWWVEQTGGHGHGKRTKSGAPSGDYS